MKKGGPTGHLFLMGCFILKIVQTHFAACGGAVPLTISSFWRQNLFVKEKSLAYYSCARD